MAMDRSPSYQEPARELPVIGTPDVLVVGAGSAGVAAAVAAARRGADTLLIEASGCLGGLATVGLINLLLTLDDGASTQVVAGLCQEVVDRLDVSGNARYPPRGTWGSEASEVVASWRPWGLIWGAPPEAVRYSVAFDPEAFVDICYDLLEEAGAQLRLHTWFAAAPVSGSSIDAVIVESKRGREAIRPRVVIDATGDGDVLVSAGARFEQVSIPPHLWFRVGGVADDAMAAAPDGGLGLLWFRTTAPGRVLVPFGPHPERVDACDPDDLTRAEVACRRAARAHFNVLRSQMKGFEGAWLDDYARMLGITESRRLVGDYVLRKEDGDVRFADAVAQTGHWTRRNVVYDIPYRCLTTSLVDNLLVAGRCISATRYVHQATKEIPAAMASGEAAGAAAAAAAARATTGSAAAGGAPSNIRTIDVAALRRDLSAQGAIVGPGIRTEASRRSAR
ncbi:MAG TPA: FAD-dependent oxidoreductase [Acidimicrobiales bacterium]|nr:FAD-dependent oxidoreductase [Acidimicrobiales bacterium]